ncbi:hypothetical protein ON010_g12593 [Phytophthora cinnamomi]|nr:hypothetical protein ON010_g12593 [Phytophthora cinnamomi]
MKVHRVDRCLGHRIRSAAWDSEPVEAVDQVRGSHDFLRLLLCDVHFSTIKHHLELSASVDLRHRKQVLVHAWHVKCILNADVALLAVGQSDPLHHRPDSHDLGRVAVGDREFTFVAHLDVDKLGLVVADVVRGTTVDRP